MTGYKRFSILALCCFLMFSMVSFAAADKAIYTTLYLPIEFEAQIPPDIDLINQALKELTEKKIGASVQLVPLLRVFGDSSSATADQVRVMEVELLKKQGVTFDILSAGFLEDDTIVLDDLLAAYGTGISSLFTEERLQYCRKDGLLYYLPSYSDCVSSVGVAMRKDLIEKYQIDVSTINSPEALDAVYALISANEPDLKMISPYQTRLSLASPYRLQKLLSNSICDFSKTMPDTIVNYYATDEYRRNLELCRQWYLAGYMPEMTIQNISAFQLVKAGELFSYQCAYKPGIEFEASSDSGYEMVVVPIADPIKTRTSLNRLKWSISSSCQNPGKAMMFLNLLYTDAELINLLIYGIEDIHYVWNDDGTIGYPDGVDQTSVGYHYTMPWVLPNQFLSYIWEGNDLQLWQQIEEFNATSPFSQTVSFAMDLTGFEALNSSLNTIAGKYTYGLETGQLDPDIYLEQMLAELDAAGADILINEVQRQYDEFLQKEGSSL